MRRQTVKFRLDELSVETASWPVLREFYDALTKALASVGKGVSPVDVVPVGFQDGSWISVASLPASSLATVRRIIAGPRPDWSVREEAACQDLWAFYQRRSSIRVALSERPRARLFKLTVPTGPPPWEVRQLESLRGYVFRAGGENGDVEIRIDGHGLLRCRAGRDTAKKMAGCLYQRVRIDCRTRRWSNGTRLMEPVEVLSFEPLAEAVADPWEHVRAVSKGVDLMAEVWLDEHTE